MTSIVLPLISRRLPAIRIQAASLKTLKHHPIRIRSLSPRIAGVALSQFASSFTTTAATMMKPEELKHYLADQPPSVVRLEIEKHFALLTEKQKRYAHFISK